MSTLPVKYFSFHSQIELYIVVLYVSVYAVKNLISGLSGIILCFFPPLSHCGSYLGLSADYIKYS